MAVLTLAELKALWVNGFVPTEDDYIDLFDSFENISGGSNGQITDYMVELISTFDEIKGTNVTEDSIGTVLFYGASNFGVVSDDTIQQLNPSNLPIQIKVVTTNEVGYLNVVQNYENGMGVEFDSFNFTDIDGNELPYSGGTGNLDYDVALPAFIETAANATIQSEFNASIIQFVKDYTHGLTDVLKKENKANDEVLQLGNTQKVPAGGGGVQLDYYGLKDLNGFDSANRFLSVISNNGIQILARDNISLQATNAGKSISLQAPIIRFSNRVSGDFFGTGQFDFTQMSNNENRIFTFPDNDGEVLTDNNTFTGSFTNGDGDTVVVEKGLIKSVS